MSGYLIKDTTKQEREQIVSDSLGNISASCDGCMPGLAEMYQEYIDGKKEIREINMMFQARYVSGESWLQNGIFWDAVFCTEKPGQEQSENESGSFGIL